MKQGRIKANLTLDAGPKTLYTSGIEMFSSWLAKKSKNMRQWNIASNPSNLMTRRHFLRAAAPAALGGLALPSLLSAASPQSARPNIVFVMADDLGYGDVQAFNPQSNIATPHLDSVAQQGMMFTDAHSGSAVCTPTRYGVLTGRYCWRSRLKSGVLNGYSSHLVDAQRDTVASLMQRQGYHTACIGKWHLGMDFPRAKAPARVDYHGVIQHGPNTNGFDHFYGISASLDFPPYVYMENDRFTEQATQQYKATPFPGYSRSGEQGPSFKHIEALDHLTGKATAYLTARSKEKTPFFLYFPLTSPHKPVLPAPRFRGKSSVDQYGDFVMHTDWVIGEIQKTLTATGLSDNTLLIVTSDNGSYMYRLDAPECPDRLTSKTNKPVDDRDHVTHPEIQGFHSKHHTANGPLRGTKADIWEGGHRVPFMAQWPGRIKPGTRCDQTICHIDLMATVADILGVPLPNNAGPDSVSFAPLFGNRRDTWRRPPVIHHSANGTFALRAGRWKLIAGSGSGGRGTPRSKPWSKPYQLYDMQADPGETHDLASQHPDRVTQLTQTLTRLREADHSRPDM